METKYIKVTKPDALTGGNRRVSIPLSPHFPDGGLRCLHGPFQSSEKLGPKPQDKQTLRNFSNLEIPNPQN